MSTRLEYIDSPILGLSVGINMKNDDVNLVDEIKNQGFWNSTSNFSEHGKYWIGRENTRQRQSSLEKTNSYICIKKMTNEYQIWIAHTLSVLKSSKYRTTLLKVWLTCVGQCIYKLTVGWKTRDYTRGISVID